MSKKDAKQVAELTLAKALPFILIGAGIVGLLASLALTYDKIQLLQNSAYEPSCNINPVFSCLSVMKTEQASFAGMPNTLFGIVAFTALTTVGFVLAAGATLKRWIWQAMQLAATLGLLGMLYLFFQGVYRIGVICPWCFVVWMITIPTFWYITLFNLREGHLKLSGKLTSWNTFLQKNHGNILTVFYIIIFGILLYEFWYYWSTLI